MSNYNAIDLVKFFMAICVVTIHTNVVSLIENIYAQRVLSMTIYSAVPYFFTTSAYLVITKKNKSDRGGYFVKLLRMYVIWSIIYYASTSLVHRQINVETALDALKSFLFKGYVHLWYVWGILLVMPVILFWVSKRKKPYVFICISVFAYFLLRGMSYYCYHPEMLNSQIISQYIPLATIKNVSISCVYISIGAFHAIKKIGRKQSLFILLLGVTLAICGIDASSQDMALYIPLISFGLFPIVKNSNIVSLKINFKLLRLMSTYIYLTHGVMISVIILFCKMPSFLNWATILLFSTAISSIIIGVKSRGYLSLL